MLVNKSVTSNLGRIDTPHSLPPSSMCKTMRGDGGVETEETLKQPEQR